MSVEILLERNEALVLFNFLSRILDEQNGEKLQGAAAHDGELWALNALLGVLEKALAAPFDQSYVDQVDVALNALTTKCGAWP